MATSLNSLVGLRDIQKLNSFYWGFKNWVRPRTRSSKTSSGFNESCNEIQGLGSVKMSHDHFSTIMGLTPVCLLIVDEKSSIGLGW